MSRVLFGFFFLFLSRTISVDATTVMAVGRIELYQNDTTVNADALSEARAEMVSPEHLMMTSISVSGELYRYVPDPNPLYRCETIVQFVESVCNGQKLVSKNPTVTTCSTADSGTCDDAWYLRSSAVLRSLDGEQLGFADRHNLTCQTLQCQPPGGGGFLGRSPRSVP